MGEKRFRVSSGLNQTDAIHLLRRFSIHVGEDILVDNYILVFFYMPANLLL